MPQLPTTPSRDDGVTIACPICTRPFVPVGRQRVCSAACRQAAYRRRQQAPLPPLALPPRRSRREGTIYQCPACEARYLGTQRCPECGLFCQRVGPGGLCPQCQEPVAVAELVDGLGGQA
jgi:hypothetical protein